MAIVKSHRDVVALLLDRGADANRADHDGAGPLLLAIGRGRGAIARLLLAAGADIHQTHPGTGATPLGVARGRRAADRAPDSPTVDQVIRRAASGARGKLFLAVYFAVQVARTAGNNPPSATVALRLWSTFAAGCFAFELVAWITPTGLLDACTRGPSFRWPS